MSPHCKYKGAGYPGFLSAHPFDHKVDDLEVCSFSFSEIFFFLSFFSRNIFLSHFIAIRGEGVVAPPLFYIIAAEKDKIKNLKHACFKRDNQVNPI